MKILFLCSAWNRGPAKESSRITLEGLKKELVKLGHTVRILPTNEWKPSIGRNYDVIHGFSAAPIKVLKTYWAGRKNKKAITLHTIKSLSPHPLFGRYRFASLLNLVDAVTVPLESMKENIFFVRKPIHIIRSNIDTKKFKPKKVKKPRILKGKPLVFYWGALWNQKGVKDLLKAAKLLPDINFLIIPRGEFTGFIPYLPNNVNFLDDKDIVKYLNMSDLVCLPYRTLVRTEANPSCLLEAWACKKPVVTCEEEYGTNLFLGDIAEGKVLWTEPMNPKYLAHSIKTVLKEKSWMKQIVKAAYKASKEFDNKVIAKQYESIYIELLEDKDISEALEIHKRVNEMIINEKNCKFP